MRISALVLIEASQVVKRYCHAGIVGTKNLFPDCQRTCQERLALCVLALVNIEQAQIAEARGHVRIVGTEGFLRPLAALEVPPPQDEGQTDGHASVIADFLAALEDNRPPETVGSDNIKSLAMVFGAIESAAAKARVEIAI